MNWKNELEALERSQRWDDAIAFMEKIISKNLDDVEMRIYMNYLLMNLLVNELYDVSKHSYYEQLTKKYFDESYKRFSGNAEYLYYTAHTTIMSPWFFGLDDEDYLKMFEQARVLEPDNLLYQSNYYRLLDESIPENRTLAERYLALILPAKSTVRLQLLYKGELGEYIWGKLLCWCEGLLGSIPYPQELKP